MAHKGPGTFPQCSESSHQLASVIYKRLGNSRALSGDEMFAQERESQTGIDSKSGRERERERERERMSE